MATINTDLHNDITNQLISLGIPEKELDLKYVEIGSSLGHFSKGYEINVNRNPGGEIKEIELKGNSITYKIYEKK